MNALLALVPAALLLPTAPAAQEDGDGSWPQWRGPDRDAIAKETRWSSEGAPEATWEVEVGLGYSSVSIADGRLYTTGYDKDGGVDLVFCLDARTGDEIWVDTYPAKIWDNAHKGGTLTTPTIDGDVLYVLNREGNLRCYDAKTGKVKWHRNHHEELDLEYPTWGYAASPLVLGDELIVNMGKVLWLDKATGDVKHASANYGHAYATPAAFELEGTPALAVFNSEGLALIDRAAGKEHALYEWKTQYDINAATPTVVDNEVVFISSGYNHGAALLAIADGELIPVWESKAMKNQMSGSVLIDGHLYGFDGSILKCIDLMGEEKWSQRGIGEGAILGTPDRLVVIGSRGELVIAAASPEKYEELSRKRVIEDGGIFWTRPVLLDGMIYCRSNEGMLVCRDHTGSAQ
jgi:outer membrane protein assembly factor BamB